MAKMSNHNDPARRDEICEDWIQFDLCDGWYQKLCSGLPLPFIFQMEEFRAKYFLLLRCKSRFEKLGVTEIPRRTSQVS